MRLKEIRPDAMTERQRRAAEAVTAGKRGTVPAPMRAWLHSPDFADRTQRLGEFIRFDTSFGPALTELAILVTARFWTAQYEWYAHKKLALAAGLDPAIIDAVGRREEPVFTDPRAKAVYDYAKVIHAEKKVPQAIHDAAVAAIGEGGVVELVGTLGYYTLVSMTLNAFEIGLPDGETPELAP